MGLLDLSRVIMGMELGDLEKCKIKKDMVTIYNVPYHVIMYKGSVLTMRHLQKSKVWPVFYVCALQAAFSS